MKPPTATAINQADQVLHSLAQLLATTAMQWLPDLPDDSQANLLYNAQSLRLESRPFTVEDRAVRLVLNTPDLLLLFIDDAENLLGSYAPEQQSPAQTWAWWQAQMQAWGRQTIRPLNYQLNVPPVAMDAAYVRPAALPVWNYWRAEANTALSKLNDWSGQASEVRIWPHHFDTGVYYARPDADGREPSAIWAGYAIADTLSPLPYFYLSGYMRGHTIDFALFAPLSVGKWHSSADWRGAILPISSVQDAADIDRFFQESYDHLANYLSHLR